MWIRLLVLTRSTLPPGGILEIVRAVLVVKMIGGRLLGGTQE